MATRTTKKEETEIAVSTIDKTPIEEVKVVDPEKEALKEQLKEMQIQMQMLMAQMNGTNTVNKNTTKDKNITFVNMTRGTLVLRGSQMWSIDGQFNSRTFSEREARVIVSNMNRCVRSGNVYITDADFVAENDLLDAYQYILSDEELKGLLNKDSKYVIETYKMVSDEQKKIIISMITDKREKNEEVDGNVLVQLGKLSGKDLTNIEPLDD